MNSSTTIENYNNCISADNICIGNNRRPLTNPTDYNNFRQDDTKLYNQRVLEPPIIASRLYDHNVINKFNNPSTIDIGNTGLTNDWESFNYNIDASDYEIPDNGVNVCINESIGIVCGTRLLPSSSLLPSSQLLQLPQLPSSSQLPSQLPSPDKRKCVDVTLGELIYDPRDTSYGPSYRHYIDNLTGQPRYFYDDIDAKKYPSYMTRNKIDHLSYAPQIGNVGDNESLHNIRNKVHEQYDRNSLLYRSDMTKELVEKMNNRARQMEIAPLYNQQF